MTSSNIQTKDYLFELKEVAETGVFEGFLSVYDVVDLGGEVVERGAFTKTIRENKGKVPLLWQHDHRNPIGHLQLEDKEKGLWVRGHLLLDADIPEARKAYKLIKSGIVRGMSIGYLTVKDRIDEGIRRLKELVLMEGSVVTFPMLPEAQIAAVKADPFSTLTGIVEAHVSENPVSPDDLGRLIAILQAKAADTRPGGAADQGTPKAEAGDTSEEAVSTSVPRAASTLDYREAYRSVINTGIQSISTGGKPHG